MTVHEKYDSLKDEEIIKLINNGDQDAVDYLLEKYKNLVIQKARTLYLIGGDKDDLIQEGMIGLYKAIRDYKDDKDSSFSNFANLCVSRQIYSAIKASNRKKNIPLNTYISLNTPILSDNSEGDDKPSLVDVMFRNNNLNPEEMLIDKENTNMIEYELERRLSKLEKQVIRLYLGGLKYIQIADVLGKPPKSIDNALQRIKSKLNLLLKDIG
ncbi:RNA polymerase sporulation sigma factor SigH [Anaeromicropila herbilytica]|uniref:RNA polymerase sigma factor SigS n=1 Tax=Anaeromicropila herbilytica TaxID=2785025 RepID=A0A7R7IES4_9FIRM|nr:RNA polymerase sporulation sigma factor SigH [Anaeromicropila herbilytica]BCN32419.1 RNA polymerase sigma-H factor [Anaeromicropila herbilytica]